MITNRTLNAFQANILAICLSAGPALGLAYALVWYGFGALGLTGLPMTGSMLIVWAVPGLLGAMIWIRPVEDFLRHEGYRLNSISEAKGLNTQGEVRDDTSDAVAEALTRQLEEELRR